MPVIKFFTRFFAAILPNFLYLIKAFREKGGRIPFWIAVTDFLFVLRGMWMFLLLNLLGFVFFFVLSQGTDMLTAIMEDTKNSYAGTILWLVLGTFCWSIVAEFGARYSMNVTDNSGKTLTDERVEWRKLLQKFFSRFFLFLPTLTLLLGFSKAAIINYDYSFAGFLQPWKDVGITLFIFLVLFIFIYNLYEDKNWIKKTSRLFRFLRLSEPGTPQDDETKWQEKIYGIYRDYIFMLPESMFAKNKNTTTDCIYPSAENTEADQALLGYPQSENILPKNRVPKGFALKRFEWAKPGDMWVRWVYRVPFPFFTRLHRQVAIISLSAIGLIFLVSLLPIGAYKNIGSAGLVTLAFAAWLGMYIGLIFLDFSHPFRINPPWRLFLFAWLIFCSAVNEDHPIRKKTDAINVTDARPGIREHFYKWAAAHPKDSIVVFVCAEGGAMRTGAFTSMILSRIQDKDSSFKNRILAFSSVSGGSLGVGYFNALAYFHSPATDSTFYSTKTKDFFTRDHLAPLIGKMFYGDIINLFSPRMIRAFDRAAALEKSWERGYEMNAADNTNSNVFAEDYFSVYKQADKNYYPAWFINSEEVETGLQGWITNVNPAGLPLYGQRDILKKVEGTVRYSTAINFSTRFPLFSPAAAVQSGLLRYHYVDGGYIENYGAQTMLEVLQELNRDSLFRRYKPYVMLIQFGNSNNIKPHPVTFGNELSEIVTAIYNSRSGSAANARFNLMQFVDSLHGSFIDIPLDMSVAQVPLNWVLSDTSLNKLDHYCNRLINSNQGIKDILKAMQTKK